jgi:hypothetical protein
MTLYYQFDDEEWGFEPEDREVKEYIKRIYSPQDLVDMYIDAEQFDKETPAEKRWLKLAFNINSMDDILQLDADEEGWDGFAGELYDRFMDKDVFRDELTDYFREDAEDAYYDMVEFRKEFPKGYGQAGMHTSW